MTIEKGVDWGTEAPLPEDGVIVRSDAEARALIELHRRTNQPIPTLGLVGGDMWRTLGAPLGGEERLRSSTARQVPVDLGAALVDGQLHWFISHLVARRSWWRGRVLAAMNAEWMGDWDLAPKSHPNDGRLDIFDTDMSFGQRWHARRRLKTGDHVPHGDIRSSRRSAAQFDFTTALTVYLDGESVGSGRTISVRVEPDALTIVV